MKSATGVRNCQLLFPYRANASVTDTTFSSIVSAAFCPYLDKYAIDGRTPRVLLATMWYIITYNS